MNTKGEQGVFASPVEPKLMFKVKSMTVFRGFSKEEGAKTEVQFTDQSKGVLYTLAGNCSDDMSEILYSHSVLLDRGSKGIFKGCCGVVEQFQVLGVDQKDRLNVRKGPSSKEKVVFQMPPDAMKIRKVRCQQGWCKIRWQTEKSGWVNKKFIKAYKP